MKHWLVYATGFGVTSVANGIYSLVAADPEFYQRMALHLAHYAVFWLVAGLIAKSLGVGADVADDATAPSPGSSPMGSIFKPKTK